MIKLLLILTAVLLSIPGTFAAGGKLFTAPAKSAPVIGAALAEKGKTLALIFKLSKDAPADFTLTNAYLFTDSDRNTGRKGIGNEYYFDIAKKMISTYEVNGKGTLHRNAFSIFRDGQWYIITFDRSITEKNPLKEFEMIFNAGKKRSVIKLKGSGFKTDDLPDFPERYAKAAGKAAAKSTLRPVAAKPAPSGKVDIFLAPSLTKLTTAADSTGIKDLQVKALRNAYEDFQLAVWFGKPDRGSLQLRWSDLADSKGRKLAGAKLEFFRLIKVPFSEPIAPESKRLIRVPSTMPVQQKMILDRLTPYKAGSNTGDYKRYLAKTFTIWYATAYFPAGTPPGKYSTSLQVTYPGGKETVKVTFDVNEFVVPERPNFVMFADMPRLVNYTSSKFSSAKLYPNAMTLNLEKCLKDMSEHRVALRSLPAKVGLTFDKNEQPVLDFSKFDPLASYVLDELKMNTRMEMPLATVSTGHSSKYTKLYGPIDTTQISDEFRRKYTATLRAILKHLRKKGWDKYFFAYFSDEPARSDFGQMAEVARIIKKADPSLEPWIYGPGPREEFMDVLTTWMGGFGTPLEEGEIQGDTNAKCIKQAIARGDKIGVYNPHSAYVLNATPSLTRSLYWWAYQYDLYWMSMYCLGYFTTGPQDLTNRRYWHYWVYPPTPGSDDCWESSIRWEATRNGMTDYELLFAAEKAVDALKKQLPAAAGFDSRAIPLEYANAVSFNRENRSGDAALLCKVRDLLIRENNALSAAVNSTLPAFAHYRFDGQKVFVEVYAPANTKVQFRCGDKVLGNAVSGKSAPALLELAKADITGKEIEISLNGKVLIRKNILAPFGK